MDSSDALKDHLLEGAHCKSIQTDPASPAYRLILLRESESSQIPTKLREWILQQPSVSITPLLLQQSYDDFSAEEVDDSALFDVGVSPNSPGGCHSADVL